MNLCNLFFVCFVLSVTNATFFNPKLLIKYVASISSYIRIQVYYGKKTDEYTILPYANQKYLNSTDGFNSSNPTIFYFPGWGEYPRSGKDLWPSLQTLIPAFRSLANTNLVLFDYYDLIRFNSYSGAISNSSDIGDVLAHFFAEHIPSIQPREKVRLIGHSLGCQIISNVARSYIDLGRERFSSITGLDPAGPGYRSIEKHLKASDADYVDIIHTNIDGLGMAGFGTINFYVNGGSVQPFCFSTNWTVGCAHYMSWRIYSEAILNPSGFMAKKCTSFCQNLFPLCSCTDNDVAYIGFEIDTSKTGDYFLRTNNKSPFALGKKGIEFNKLSLF